MQGYSEQIKLVLDNILSGLEYRFQEEDLLDPEKLEIIMKSKVSSFDITKGMLMDWVASPNAPSKKTLAHYLDEMINSGDKAVLTLRSAFIKEIDFGSLDPEKHNQAIRAKGFLNKAILEMNKSILELKRKREAGDFDFADKEFEVGYPEWFGKGQFYPKTNYWKKWLENTKDGSVVNIDPFSTKGKIIDLFDLKVRLPKPPKDKSKILFSELPKKDQYWRRLEVPDNITPDNVDLFDDWIREEFRRRREGVWFMNNGKPVYLTGNHYFALQWCKMLDNGQFMNFRYAQLYMFYHLEACIVDKRCLGQVFLKSRRTGFTYIVLAILLNMSTGTANAKYGMTSKSGDDVQEAFDKFSYMFLSLPFFFRPVVKGKEDSPSELFFGKPSNNSKEAKKSRKTGVEDYLNTNVDHRPTKNDSYDSVKLNGYLGDECVSPDTKVLMSDLTWKEAKDIRIGDRVMSGDGTEQEVLKVGGGVDHMYRVIEPYGVDYVVNSRHKLLFNQGNSKLRSKNISITAPEYLKMTDYKKSITRARKWDGIEYPERKLKLDPYFLGLWLGDGSSKSSQFIVEPNKDSKIYNYLVKYAEDNGLKLVHCDSGKNWVKVRLNDPNATGANQATGSKHKVVKPLKDLGIWGNKRVPKEYFFSSREQRLKLLAGIIDTDGYKKNGVNSYSIGMSRKSLIEDIRFLCMTLGISVSNIVESLSNYNTKVYRIQFSPTVDSIPVLLDRKRSNLTKSGNRRRVKVDVKYEGVGEYVGFEITPNSLGEHSWVGEASSLISNCAKWKKPNDYIVHLGMVAPTMMPAGRVIGKAFLGSTMGARTKGGEQMIELIEGSKVKDRDETTGKTTTGLYFYFLPAQENMEEFTDKYGFCHTVKPPKGTLNVLGEEILVGSIDYLKAVEEQKRKQSDKALNEQLRTYPRTVEHALRDEDDECVFNAAKIYEQIDHNESIPQESRFVVGNFKWKSGVKDTDVEFYPDPKGRFKVSWLPSKVDNTEHLKNAVKSIHGKFFPRNLNCVRFGCDPFSIAGVNGSKGGLHGKTIQFPEGGAPSDKFVMEYIARPSDETIFFEDVIKVCRYYGAPILVESNRIDLLRHMYNRGYRGFAMNRLDRRDNKLSENERKYGGQPMSGQDILDSHMNAIGLWIENKVGVYSNEELKVRPIGEMGEMPFTETLRSWLAFDPKKRTEHDATISSGLAIMACNTERYKPKKEKQNRKNVGFLFKKYDNTGSVSRPINKQKGIVNGYSIQTQKVRHK
jgi:hypothetical protein